MLKPIPQENPDDIRKTTAKKAKRFMAAGPGKAALARGPLERADEREKDRESDAADPVSGFFAEGPGANPSSCCDAAKPVKEGYFRKMHQKMQAEAKKDNSILKGACIRLIRFIRKNGRSSKQEVMDLIHGLQRSVLSLERQRQRDFIKERKRKKK